AARERVRAHVVGRPGVRTDDLDGLTVEHWDEGLPREDRWWFSLRSSHTESLLRLNVEAEQEGAMRRLRDEVLALVQADGGGPGAHPASAADFAAATAPPEGDPSTARGPGLPARAHGA